jgi:hypothetical protein
LSDEQFAQLIKMPGSPKPPPPKRPRLELEDPTAPSIISFQPPPAPEKMDIGVEGGSATLPDKVANENGAMNDMEVMNGTGDGVDGMEVIDTEAVKDMDTEAAKDMDTDTEAAKEMDTEAAKDRDTEAAKDMDTDTEAAKDMDSDSEAAKDMDSDSEAAKDMDTEAAKDRDTDSEAANDMDTEAANDMDTEAMKDTEDMEAADGMHTPALTPAYKFALQSRKSLRFNGKMQPTVIGPRSQPDPYPMDMDVHRGLATPAKTVNNLDPDLDPIPQRKRPSNGKTQPITFPSLPALHSTMDMDPDEGSALVTPNTTAVRNDTDPNLQNTFPASSNEDKLKSKQQLSSGKMQPTKSRSQPPRTVNLKTRRTGSQPPKAYRRAQPARAKTAPAVGGSRHQPRPPKRESRPDKVVKQKSELEARMDKIGAHLAESMVGAYLS